MLRNALLLPRARLNMPFKQRPKEAPLFHVPGVNLSPADIDRQISISVPINDHFVSLFLMMLSPPGILFSPSRTIDTFDVWLHNFDNPTNISKRFGPGMFRMGQIKLNAYTRFFSKIGYSYACARLGYNNFEPLVNGRIVEDNEPNDFLYVGGLNMVEHKMLENHYLSLARWDDYVVALVRIFADLGAPTHIVVVGKISPCIELNLPNLKNE